MSVGKSQGIGGGDLAPVSSCGPPPLDQLHTLRVAGFTLTAFLLRRNIRFGPLWLHWWCGKKKVILPVYDCLLLLLLVSLLFSFFLNMFYLFYRTTTCSVAPGGAAADEQAGRVGLRRKSLFHCGLLWEHSTTNECAENIRRRHRVSEGQGYYARRPPVAQVNWKKKNPFGSSWTIFVFLHPFIDVSGLFGSWVIRITRVKVFSIRFAPLEQSASSTSCPKWGSGCR